MEEKIWDSMKKAADVMHWLGKYEECNALIMTARLMQAYKLESLADWTLFVEEQVHH